MLPCSRRLGHRHISTRDGSCSQLAERVIHRIMARRVPGDYSSAVSLWLPVLLPAISSCRRTRCAYSSCATPTAAATAGVTRATNTGELTGSPSNVPNCLT